MQNTYLIMPSFQSKQLLQLSTKMTDDEIKKVWNVWIDISPNFYMKKQATQLIHGNVNGPTMGTTALPPAQLECKQNPKDSSKCGGEGRAARHCCKECKWCSRATAENCLLPLIHNKLSPQGPILPSPPLRRRKSTKASVHTTTCLWMFMAVYFLTVKSRNILIILQTVNK